MNGRDLLPGLGLLVLILGTTAAWSWAGGHMPARGGAAALAVVTLAGAVVLARRGMVLPPPAWIAAAAWIWYLLSWTWTPVPDPGWIRVVERGAALAVACGACAWWAGRTAGIAATLGVFGAGMLTTDALGQITWGGQPWCLALGLGADPPCGNPNFTVGAALPLLVVGFAGWSSVGTAIRLVLLIGAAGAVVLGTGALSGDATRAVWPAAVAGAGIWWTARLPRPWAGIVLVLGLAIAVLLPLALAWAGWYSPAIGPSGVYRINLWQAAGQAIETAPWLGHGAGASISVLPGMPAYGDAWLAVPSYPEHAHQELLEALVEGGVPLAVLLVAALGATAWPLWTLRSDPLPRALLAGGATALALALVESHLSQPVPLLVLALLAGGAWTVVRSTTTIPARPVLGGVGMVFAVLLSLQVVREALAGDDLAGAGPPPVVELVHRRAMEVARREGDWPRMGMLAQHLEARLGPLTDLWHLQAEAAARQRDVERAVNLTLAQAERLPLLPAHIDLLDRLERQARAKHWPTAPRLAEARARIRARIQDLAIRDRTTDRAEVRAWLVAWAAREP